MTIRAELQKLMGSRELTNPRDIEAWARRNPESSLHKNLKYDDPEGAAHEWRINQVRKFICVYMIDSVTRKRDTISLSLDRGNGGYRHMEPTLSTPNLRDIAVNDLLKKLLQLKEQYEELGFDEFVEVWDAVESVKSELRPTPYPHRPSPETRPEA